MITKDSIHYVDSDRDLHFTDSLIQYASEYEDINLGGVAGTEARCYIAEITMTTATNHAFIMSFHPRTGGLRALAATPYLPAQGTMLDFWSWVATDAMATGTQWVYATTGLKIPYRDEAGTGQLHVGLHNRSSSTKGALGATLPAGVSPQYIQVRFGLVAAA